MHNSILAGTGHRLEVLGSKQDFVNQFAFEVLTEMKPSKVISGMAQGWDHALAHAASELGIPFIAAVPFKGQEFVWSEEAKQAYFDLLDKASEVVYVCKGGYATHKYHERDKWMVDHCEELLALWNGQQFGGTYKTRNMAIAAKKNVMNVWPGWIDYKSQNS